MTLGAALAVFTIAPAGAASMHTAPLQPGDGEKLVCTVVNVNAKTLQMAAQIVDRFGDNVTDFVRTDWNADETTIITLRADSSNPNARYCKIVVTGGRKADVAASLQACSYDESACSSPVAAH
ncbi:MAG: hypothetical protein ACREQL_12905 [Candidatus Binatia bacterium]